MRTRIHTVSGQSKHWLLVPGESNREGANCSVCGATRFNPCKNSIAAGDRLPATSVHLARVETFGHNVYRTDVMPKYNPKAKSFDARQLKGARA